MQNGGRHVRQARRQCREVRHWRGRLHGNHRRHSHTVIRRTFPDGGPTRQEGDNTDYGETANAAHIKQNQVPTSNGIACPHRPEYALLSLSKLIAEEILLIETKQMSPDDRLFALAMFYRAAILDLETKVVSCAGSLIKGDVVGHPGSRRSGSRRGEMDALGLKTPATVRDGLPR